MNLSTDEIVGDGSAVEDSKAVGSGNSTGSATEPTQEEPTLLSLSAQVSGQ